MRLRYLILVPLLVGGVLTAGAAGGKVEYVGGTVAELNSGPKGLLVTTGDTHLVFQAQKVVYVVPWERINTLEYGQNVGRRYAMAVLVSPLLVLSKARRHYLTVGFTDDVGAQQVMVFRVDKDAIRTLLVSLEAKTNLLVSYQDDEARRAGKGN